MRDSKSTGSAGSDLRSSMPVVRFLCLYDLAFAFWPHCDTVVEFAVPKVLCNRLCSPTVTSLCSGIYLKCISYAQYRLAG